MSIVKFKAAFYQFSLNISYENLRNFVQRVEITLGKARDVENFTQFYPPWWRYVLQVCNIPYVREPTQYRVEIFENHRKYKIQVIKFKTGTEIVFRNRLIKYSWYFINTSSIYISITDCQNLTETEHSIST